MKCQRDKFNLQRKYAYLNCAYMSPLLKKVENAGIKGLKSKRKPYQITAEDFFHETEVIRGLFSQLINNPSPDRICIIPSVSYGIANVTNNLPFSDGKILLVEEQFPSNVYPWLALENKGVEVEFIGPSDSAKKGESWNQKILEAINTETRVLAMGHVHWADGTLFDLEAIRAKLDEVGGLLIIDGTQSVGALPFDVQKFRPDALICAAYKWLMGPYAIGLAYYGPAFDNGNPIEHSWMNRVNSEEFSGLVSYEENFRPLALRYEVGEHSNFILIPMLHKALNQLLRWGVTSINNYCEQLMADMLPEITGLGYTIENPAFRSPHLFGIRLGNKMDMNEVKNSFARNKVSVSYRGDAIRVSPHVYNDDLDIRKLLKALKAPILAS